MPEIALSVDVDVPVERLWAAVTDWARQGEWMLGTTVRPTAQDGRGEGGRIEAFTGIGPLGVLDRMLITRWDPPWRCEVRHEGFLINGSALFEVQPLEDGRSRFVWAEWLVPPFGLVGQVAFAVGAPLAKVGVWLSLRQLARWAPQRTETAAPADVDTGAADPS